MNCDRTYKKESISRGFFSEFSFVLSGFEHFGMIFVTRHRIASHRIASHRIASHRIASHRIASLVARDIY
jgi:hypothetical protein